MTSDLAIIGGADGPTSIFLAEKTGGNWINTFGLIFVLLLLIPNIIYAIKMRGQENRCTNSVMNVLEQVGRYGCMFLMIFNIGIAEFGFGSVEAFLIYLFGNVILMILYWGIWALYFKKPAFWKQIALALIPTALFLLNGITMRHYLLIIFAVIFGIGHLYVTNMNRVK